MYKKTKLPKYILHSFFFFFLVSISHSSVIHREICAKELSGTSASRILKFLTNMTCYIV